MKNAVTLLHFGAGDELHAAAGWASTGGLTEEKRKRIPDFLMRLGKSVPRHTVPFEHSQITFLVTAEYASHIHQLKHRIGVSVNAESARYQEFKEDKFYIPSEWPKEIQKELEAHCLHSFELYHSTIKSLVSSGMNRKRAKETARYFLTIATQINFVVTFNFLSFTHFLMLRNSSEAQLEICMIASEMLRLVKTETKDSFQHSLAAFGL